MPSDLVSLVVFIGHPSAPATPARQGPQPGSNMFEGGDIDAWHVFVIEAQLVIDHQAFCRDTEFIADRLSRSLKGT